MFKCYIIQIVLFFTLFLPWVGIVGLGSSDWHCVNRSLPALHCRPFNNTNTNDKMFHFESNHVNFLINLCRQLQLFGRKVPHAARCWLPPGTIVPADNPHCGHLVGVILDGRGLSPWPHDAGGHNVANSVHKIFRWIPILFYRWKCICKLINLKRIWRKIKVLNR